MPKSIVVRTYGRPTLIKRIDGLQGKHESTSETESLMRLSLRAQHGCENREYSQRYLTDTNGEHRLSDDD